MSEPASYSTTIENWRRAMDEKLRAENGWLALAGLFWLHEGHNRFGADPSNDIVLPPGSAPDYVGSFEFHAGQTQLHVAAGQVVTVNGERVTEAPLQPDSSSTPSIVELGDLTLVVLQRGTRYAIRVRDKNSLARKAFPRRRWFPIQEAYRVSGTFIPYNPPKPMSLMTVLGYPEDRASPGYVEFTLIGTVARLDALPTVSGELFLIFSDQTAGTLTYPAGRYLYTPRPVDGAVTLDFNKAYNPPCAFTPFATCALPPPQNRLPFRIEAGELYEDKT
ncbi:MAG TPA: DUF1684 domain-containing protein [Anaerolineae bacterium]|nr:DUF1684 domain-containing protein [Anaerolineae bacterium]